MNNENWVTTESYKKYRNDAAKLAAKRREYEKGKQFEMVPHPDSPRAIIMKPL